MDASWVLKSKKYLVLAVFFSSLILTACANNDWKTLCMYPEVSGREVTIIGYKLCLGRHGLSPTESDLRKMCETWAEGKNQSDNPNKSANSYYLECVHSQGLSS